jgi:hypothetical protein
MSPRIQLVAYESRDPLWIFVAVPDEKGRYMRTHRCVATVPCPQCQSTTGEPCKGAYGYIAGTHHVRRSAALRAPKPHAPDVIEPEES